MKGRAELLATCAALVIGAGLVSPTLAASSKAPPIAQADPVWWYEGFVEVGGRFDLNDPDKKTLGKFYDYRDLRPGPFGNFFIGSHRSGADPIDIEIWGKNVGWDDQAFGVDFASPGTYYLTFGWDETPHVFSKDAKTLYNGVGGNTLTLRSFLTFPASADDVGIINRNSQTIDLGYRRDTATAAGRWTPNDNWDFNVDYDYTHREGTQGNGSVSFSGGGGTRSTFEVPKPVDDTTHNAHLKGEYIGTTPWNTAFNVAVGGGYSSYNNRWDSYTFENPWNPVNTANGPRLNRYSLAPDNEAGSVNVTGAVGLPFNSRYMGTFQWSNMTSDQPNLPYTINPLAGIGAGPYVTPGRETQTILSNNVIHTKITSDLESTLKYRYYNYNPQDNPASAINYTPNPDSNSGFPDDEQKLRHPAAYTKQNADAQIAYRPWKWLNVGALYDWERWDRTWRNAATTNEHTGKVFLDSKWGFSNFRASIQYSERRFDEYSLGFYYLNDTSNNSYYLMKDMANRDRTKGMISWAVDITRDITVTPNAGFRNDQYRTPVDFTTSSEIGLKQDNSWNAGVDTTWRVSPAISLFVAYMFENGYRQVFENSAPPKANVETFDQDHTVIVGSKITVIPDKLFLDVNYTFTKSTSVWNLSPTAGGQQYPGMVDYPAIHNTLNRIDAHAKYMLDDSFMRSAGFMGKAYIKARVLWEKNENDSWQSLQNQFGWLVNPGNATTADSIWLGTGNPNYDVVVGMLSFGVKW
jgi:MtrB/PioB family decaheme-associated outer membrane protein